MSGLAVTPYHVGAAVTAANRLPVSAEIVGTVTVSGSFTNAAGTNFIGRTGALWVEATGSVAPQGTGLAWEAGRCLAAAVPAVIEFAFGAGYASRNIALTDLRIAATLGGVSALHAGLILSATTFTAAADNALPALSALSAIGATAIEARHHIMGATCNLAVWSGRRTLALDAAGKLYGQLYAVQGWSVTTVVDLTIQAALGGEIL
jgi:hypothetical protein